MDVSGVAVRTSFQGVPVSGVLNELRGVRRNQIYRSTTTCLPNQLNPDGLEGPVSTKMDKADHFVPFEGGALKVERSR